MRGCSPQPGVLDVANGARFHPIAFCAFDSVAGISTNGRFVLRNESSGADPDCFTNARIDLARVLMASGRYGDARGELQKVLDEKSPQNIADWTVKDAPRARQLLESIKGK